MGERTQGSSTSIITVALVVVGVLLAAVVIATSLVTEPPPPECPSARTHCGAAQSAERQWGDVEYYALRGAELYAAGLVSEGRVNPNLVLGARKSEMSADDLAGKGLDLDPARLAAGMAVLHREAQENDELRQRLPQGVKNSLWSTDPQKAALGLAALRRAIQDDDELNFMVPIEMRLALQASIYVFPSPHVRYYHGPGGLSLPSADAGYDQESSIRSAYPSIDSFSFEPPELVDLCREAKEKFVSTYPWIVGNAEWLAFERSCLYYHSESVAKFIAGQLHARVSSHCKALIDDGWIVKDDALYRPGLDPEEMIRALEASGGTPGAYGRIAKTGGDWVPQFTKECLSPFKGTVPFHFE